MGYGRAGYGSSLLLVPLLIREGLDGHGVDRLHHLFEGVVHHPVVEKVIRNGLTLLDSRALSF